MHGAGAGVRACGTGRRGQRGGVGECREAPQDPAARLCPAAAGTAQPLGFREGGPPSRQPSTHGAGSAAGRRGVRGRRLHSPQQRLERAGARREPRPETSLRPQGDGPARGGRLAGLDCSGSGLVPGKRRAWRTPREAARRPGRRSPVPTSRVSHGWSEVLFLKRLQGGHKQPPTSLPVRAVDCQPCGGQETRAVHLAARTVGPLGWRPGKPGAGRMPLLPGDWRPRDGRLGSVVAQLQGALADQSSPRRRKLWSIDIRELPQASRRPRGL